MKYLTLAVTGLYLVLNCGPKPAIENPKPTKLETIAIAKDETLTEKDVEESIIKEVEKVYGKKQSPIVVQLELEEEWIMTIADIKRHGGEFAYEAFKNSGLSDQDTIKYILYKNVGGSAIRQGMAKGKRFIVGKQIEEEMRTVYGSIKH